MMNRKSVITMILLAIFILGSLLPMSVVSAATNETITLNSSLYKAIKAELESQGIEATYNDAQYTLTIAKDKMDSVTKLNLSNDGISDLTGLENFSNVTSLDLSANELTKESNLEVLSSLKLTSLDLSSNQISDVSAIANIKEIQALNLHNQIFNEVTIINNAMIKEGTVKYEAELPQIIRDFAKPIKSQWLTDTYINNGSSNVKIDWSSFNSNSNSMKIVIGTTGGDAYNGLVTLKIKITDVENTLYNSEINLYYVVIDENQRAISIKDKYLYAALKEQLTKGQAVNKDLTAYTNSKNLYDYAYDEQMIFVINENTLVNEIKSLVLDNRRISNLSGIEMFIGLEKSLNVSSNYINTIDRIIDLQEMKNTEEARLQERYKEKAQALQDRLTKLETLKNELNTIIKEYNEAAGKYNSFVESEDQNKAEKELEQLNIIKTKGKRYIELTGNSLSIFDVIYAQASSLDTLNEVQEKRINELSKNPTIAGGEIKASEEKVKAKVEEIYDMYNKVYKVTSVITAELRNITDREYDNLTLEQAKTLLQAQVTKLTGIEKNLTSYEKDYLSTLYGINKEHFEDKDKKPIANYFTERMKELEENKDVTQYKSELNALRLFNSYVESTNACLIHKYNTGKTTCVGKQTDEISLKEQDGESTYYLTQGFKLHNDKESATCSIDGVSLNDLFAIAGRMAKAADEDIAAFVTLPRLYSLNMNENLIENIDKISAMKELRALYLGENEIVNINNVDWSSLSMLTALNLSFNNISDIKVLEVLKNLQMLDLSKNLISGSLDFTITNMNKLVSLNLSSNQIDDIEYLKTQYEFIAKDHGMEISEYLTSNIAPNINLRYQDLAMEVNVEQTASTVKVELPAIFRQLEELQWKETSFGINSLYGNVTSDGKYVTLYTNTLGGKIAEVTVTGNGIGTGTSCRIGYTVGNTTPEKPDDKPSNPSDEKTEVIITINTSAGSNVKAVKKVNDVNYMIVSDKTTVEAVLSEVSLNTDRYNVAVKDSSCSNTINTDAAVKTNETLVIDGLEDNSKCIIVVKGDITGDGSINMSDILKLNQYRNKKLDLTDAEVLAGNVADSDDEINISDILKLNQYRLNKINEL